MRRILSIVLFLVLAALPVKAEKVVLWIQATNPLESRSQTVQIKSNLPAGIVAGDVVNLDGLELGYDIKNDVYFVHKEIELGAKGSGSENAEFRIEIKDIWVVPEEELNSLQQQAISMGDLLVGTPQEETAGGLKKLVQEKIDSIRDLQAKNAVGKTTAINHIRAYEQNSEELERLQILVGRMENLVLSVGKDPVKLIGREKEVPKPDRDFVLTEYKTATIRITVVNTSSNETRVIPNSTTPALRRDLPQEIKPKDVIDAGGLEVRTDLQSGVCYLYKDKIEIPPAEEVVFTVKIYDKWNVNEPRMKSLKERAADLMLQVQGAKTRVETVENSVQQIITDIDAIAAETGPTELNDKYVAFYREQTKRLDVVEEKMNRIKAALKPMQRTTKVGFDVKPPSMKTTWMIIYIILGFLALVSLLFFLRWYGKSQEEKLEDSGK